MVREDSLALTLLVENNPKIESFYMLNLSTWLGLEIISKKKAEFAIGLLQSEAANIDLIIVRSKIEKEDSAKILIEYLAKRKLTIPVIEVGPGKEVPGAFAHIPNSLLLKLLIQNAAKALKITAKDMADKVVPEYFPIPILYFKVLRRSVCPVYSQDIEDPAVFIPRFAKLKDFTEAEVNALVQEGITHLYVEKLHRLDFVNNVTNELMTELEALDLSADEQLTAADRSLELLTQKLLSIGITEETVKLAKKNMDTLKRTVKTNPKLAKLLERLLSNKTSYIYRHTQILAYVGSHIVRNIDWGSPDQEEKIMFIAFFHDLALADDTQARVASALDLRKANFSPEVKILVEKHAQLAAEYVTKFPHAPMGADQIIRQHHGTLNGIGFSEHWGNNVSPMSVVFIVAEEFTRIILKNEERPLQRHDLLRELKETFPTSRFQKVIELLESVTF